MEVYVMHKKIIRQCANAHLAIEERTVTNKRVRELRASCDTATLAVRMTIAAEATTTTTETSECV